MLYLFLPSLIQSLLHFVSVLLEEPRGNDVDAMCDSIVFTIDKSFVEKITTVSVQDRDNDPANYNDSATDDDGSCEFNLSSDSCPGDLDGSGLVQLNDLLDLLLYYGNECED